VDLCSNCGKEVPPEPAGMPRIPCPNCGGMVRCLTRHTSNHLHTTESVSWKQNRPGIQSSAELDDQGNIKLTAIGPSPKNEEDSLEICARLVRALNSNDGNWSEPVKGDKDVDGFSTNLKGADAKLRMQVVRASNNEKVWQELNHAGFAEVDLDAAKAAGELMGAVRKKSRKYSLAQKQELALILDACRTPGHTFQLVFDAFRMLFLAECKGCGFNQVWAVGPTDGLVVRLDQ